MTGPVSICSGSGRVTQSVFLPGSLVADGSVVGGVSVAACVRFSPSLA